MLYFNFVSPKDNPNYLLPLLPLLSSLMTKLAFFFFSFFFFLFILSYFCIQKGWLAKKLPVKFWQILFCGFGLGLLGFFLFYFGVLTSRSLPQMYEVA